jgi:hypothetical protein
MLLRKLRGCLLVGGSWAAAWTLVGALRALSQLLTAGTADILVSALPDIARVAGAWGAAGLLSGVAFAVTLMIAARGRSFRELSILRMAALGAAGTLLCWALLLLADGDFVDNLTPSIRALVMLGTLGAASAAATLVVARRQPTPSPISAPAT